MRRKGGWESLSTDACLSLGPKLNLFTTVHVWLLSSAFPCWEWKGQDIELSALMRVSCFFFFWGGGDQYPVCPSSLVEVCSAQVARKASSMTPPRPIPFRKKSHEDALRCGWLWFKLRGSRRCSENVSRHSVPRPAKTLRGCFL